VTFLRFPSSQLRWQIYLVALRHTHANLYYMLQYVPLCINVEVVLMT
jgi:hypothetical protein